jgi:hypothetical protein
VTDDKYVYFIYAAATNRVKIGFAKDPKSRLSDLESGSSEPLTLLHTYACPDAPKEEARLHAQFQKLRVHREWFVCEDEVAAHLHALTGVRVNAKHAQSRALLQATTELHQKWIMAQYVEAAQEPPIAVTKPRTRKPTWNMLWGAWVSTTHEGKTSPLRCLQRVDVYLGHADVESDRVEHTIWAMDAVEINTRYAKRGVAPEDETSGVRHTALLLSQAADDEGVLQVLFLAAIRSLQPRVTAARLDRRDNVFDTLTSDIASEVAEHLVKMSRFTQWHHASRCVLPGIDDVDYDLPHSIPGIATLMKLVVNDFVSRFALVNVNFGVSPTAT